MPEQTIAEEWRVVNGFPGYEVSDLGRVTSGAVLGGASMTTNLPPEHLASVRYVGGARLSLRFSDGYEGTVDLARLGLKTATLRLNTARVSWGSAVEVDDASDEPFHIDSAVLRAHCDPVYAKQLAAAIATMSKSKSPKPRRGRKG